MNEQKNNGRGIFYGVIGVATLVVAIIGATFAYFTATASNNIITGNMATVKLSLAVTKVTTVDEELKGMIPMSNGMVEAAVNSKNDVCVDDNGNAVCQVYKITITNDSSAGQFVDGYVALKGGSGVPADFEEYVAGAKVNAAKESVAYGTTMRWAQVFTKTTISGDTNSDGDCDTDETDCKVTTDYTTGGTQTLGAASETVTLAAIGNTASGLDVADIRTENALMSAPKEGTDTNGNGKCDPDTETTCTMETNAKAILKPVEIAGTEYDVIGTNYIRVSNHTWKTDDTAEVYDRTKDATSALVFNHSIPANGAADYYVVVWLSETGTNQTAGATVGDVTNPAAGSFFNGNVTFISAQGSEVSATFSGYHRVPAVVVDDNE